MRSSFGMCGICRHYREGTVSCDAYPQGIPIEIIENEVDHRQPYTDDQGIQFEADDPADLTWFARFFEMAFGPSKEE